MRMEESPGGRVRPGEYSLLPLEVVNINSVTVMSSEDTFLRSRAAPYDHCPPISVSHPFSWHYYPSDEEVIIVTADVIRSSLFQIRPVSGC